MLPSRCWMCLTNGYMCLRIQGTSMCCRNGGNKALGPFPQQESPLRTTPWGALQTPGCLSRWRQDCSAFPCSHQGEKNSRFTEPEGGAKNVCACVCPCIYIHIYKYVYTNMRTYTDAHIYTRTQNYSSVYWLGPHSGQGDLSPDHLFHGSVQRICQCFVGVFFIKQIIGEKKICKQFRFWRPWLVKSWAAKGLGILRLHFWAGMPNLCVSPSSGWKPVCGAGALGSLQSQWSHSVDSSELWIKSVSMLEMYCPAGVLCKEKHK